MDPESSSGQALATVGLGTLRSWTPYSLGEIAQIGVAAQFANLVQPEGANPVNEFTL